MESESGEYRRDGLLARDNTRAVLKRAGKLSEEQKKQLEKLLNGSAIEFKENGILRRQSDN
jgi:hypothetical protein